MPPHELTASVIRFFASLTVIRVGRRLFRGRDQSQGRADGTHWTNVVLRSRFAVEVSGSPLTVGPLAACRNQPRTANREL